MSKYDGMTTNERLWEAGILDSFDEAMRELDGVRMKELLVMVDLDDQADHIVETILRNPELYIPR